MTDGNSEREALDTAQGLMDTMRTLTAEVKRLRRYGRHNRRFILFDIALTVLLAVFGAVSVHAATQASRASAAAHHNAATVQDVDNALLDGCQANNIRLARQEKVLNGILRTPAHATLAARVYLAHARAEIAVGWKPRDCQKAYQLSKP